LNNYMIRKLLGNSISFKKQPKVFYVGVFFFSVLVLYVAALFIYLKIVGVYGIAVIKEQTISSEGVVYKYEFLYQGEKYAGDVTSIRKVIGSKYFVLFSKADPDKNLLQYNDSVPDCFKDSINSIWIKLPQCAEKNK
jgi:hypothetical protein